MDDLDQGLYRLKNMIAADWRYAYQQGRADSLASAAADAEHLASRCDEPSKAI